MTAKRIFVSIYCCFFVILFTCGYNRAQVVPSSSTYPDTNQMDGKRKSKLLVNQVGYILSWPKTALLVNAPASKRHIKVQLIKQATGKALFTIIPGKPFFDKASQDIVQILDFSSFTQKGCFYLRWGELDSFPFEIGKKIFDELLVKMLRSYYLQRCGVLLNDPVTGLKHKACHIYDAQIAHDDLINQAGKNLSTAGGWHDAGDYGKYVATTAVTVGRLLHIFEQNPEYFYDGQLEFPEDVSDSATGRPQSSNGIPDILDEVRVGLEWMNTMQRKDGAVYRKLSGAKWPDLVPPDQDNQPRFIYCISTPETAKMAAAMAMAARVYRPYDVAFSRRCLKAARASWKYLENNTKMHVDWHASDDSGSGTYLYSEVNTEESFLTDMDDRFWAAAELFITAADKRSESFTLEHINEIVLTLFEWRYPSALGLIDLYLAAGGKGKISDLVRAKFLQRAQELLSHVGQNGYHLADCRFIWGSNKMIAEEGITLYYAYMMSGKKEYLRAAIDQVNYLLGMNHFNKSFVTGVGSNSVEHVSHIFARAAGRDIPGLLVGGPNEKAQAGIAPKEKGALSYADDARSYATNEYAIDYNASLIALIGMIMKEEK